MNPCMPDSIRQQASILIFLHTSSSYLGVEPACGLRSEQESDDRHGKIDTSSRSK